jgi:hypothetical protein
MDCFRGKVWQPDVNNRLREPHNTLDPPDGCWIRSDEGGMAEDPDNKGGGHDWCGECGEDVAMRLNLYTPGSATYEMCWNDPCGEHDTIPCCNSCRKTLAGWPTAYCLSQELAYFEEEPDFEPNPENVHVICMVLWNLQWGEQDEGRAAWKAIGESLLAKIEAAVPCP